MNRRDLIEQAARLSMGLDAGDVKRSELSPYTEVLFHTPGTWAQRLAAADELLGMALTKQMANRSGLSRDQQALVHKLVMPILRSQRSEKEMSFLLVWTERMLKMREAGVPVPGAA